MRIKMGDIVLRKNKSSVLFKVTSFDDEYVIIKGLKFPIITVSHKNDLIKVNKHRKYYNSNLKIIK